MTVTGLPEGTTYYAAVYEFNGSGGAENYLTSSPPTAFETTTPSDKIIITIAGTGTDPECKWPDSKKLPLNVKPRGAPLLARPA